MASRAGARPLGSDGTDFQHRERVAGHYQASVTNKSRLKYVLWLHLLVILLMLCRLSVSIYVFFDIRPPRLLQRLHLPRVWLWEYVWLVSAVAAIFGLLALRKNRVFLMQQYMIGSVVFGIAPVLYGVFDLLDDLIDYWETRETTKLFLGFPVVVLWNMFLIIALQIHGFGLCFAWNLIQAWKHRGSKKTN